MQIQMLDYTYHLVHTKYRQHHVLNGYNSSLSVFIKEKLLQPLQKYQVRENIDSSRLKAGSSIQQNGTYFKVKVFHHLGLTVFIRKKGQHETLIFTATQTEVGTGALER